MSRVNFWPALLTLIAISSLGYTGALESGGLVLCCIGLLVLLNSSLNSDRGQARKHLRVTLSSFALIAGTLWIVSTTPSSISPSTSFQLAWVWAAMPLAYFCIASQEVSRSTFWPLASAQLTVIAAFVMGLAVIEFALLRSRPTSVFLDTNALAAFCNLFIFPSGMRLYSRACKDNFRSALRSAQAAFLLLAFVCLATTASRGGQLTFLIGLVALTTVLLRHDRNAWKLGAALLLMFAAALAIVSPFRLDSSALARLNGLGSDQSLSDRVEMVKSVIRMYHDAPWYGIGLGTYKVLYPMYRSVKELSTSGDLAHNDYLQFLAEGGPVLLGVLLALAGSVLQALWRLWRTAPRDAGTDESFLESLGLACALLCIFVHAIPNFVFYVLPMSLMAGLYLGRLDALRTDPVRTLDLGRVISPRTANFLLLLAIAFAAGTLGLQAAYISISTGQCKLRMCDSLVNDQKFLAKYSSLLAATQPSYLPARDWLIKLHTDLADTARTESERLDHARTAAHEVADLIQHYPAFPYTYHELADLLEAHPQAASAVPKGISTDPTALLAEALRRDPLDTATRLKLAKRLETDGKPDQAFSLVFDNGLRWFDVVRLGDQGRISMLQFAMPRALKLGRCKDAFEMAGGLQVYTPNDPLTKSVAELAGRKPAIEDGTPDCGMVAAQ